MPDSWSRRGYYEDERVDETVHRGDLTMTFQGWTYNLEDYAVALEQAGLVLDMLREPRPTGPEHAWRDGPPFFGRER